MAPALLTNDKSQEKKIKSSKQNKRKMDPENHIQEELHKSVDKIEETTKASHKKSKKLKTGLNGEAVNKIETDAATPAKEVKKPLSVKNKTKDSSNPVKDAAIPNQEISNTAAETNGSVESPAKSRKQKKKKAASNGEAATELTVENESEVKPSEILKTDSTQNNHIDLASLKLKLALEDNFISNLLTHIPSQSTSIPSKHDSDGSSDEMEDAESDQPDNRASNPEELQLRLAAKLNQFQGKKLDFSDKKMKSKLKRKLDKLEKKKLRRKQSKMRSKIAKLAQDTTKKAATSSAAAAVSSSTSTDIVKTETPEPTVQTKLPKPIFNSEGRMVFSKFDFGEMTAQTSTVKKTSLDPKAALIKIKKDKEKVKHLESVGDKEKAKAIEEKKAWEGALQRAEGIKVKDSAELLNKTIKRNEKKKQQSKKKWDERIALQEKRKDDHQKKRKENIKNKKDQKKEKKLNRMAKKGKIFV